MTAALTAAATFWPSCPRRPRKRFASPTTTPDRGLRARLRYGMIDRADGALCGVLVLGIPMHPAVLTGPFPLLEPYRQSLELSRISLLDVVAANGETRKL